ncbi:hypothetical protein [Senimuribacter intestinalis]|uniref:hypothetical protein n=1 Tax=Senimuribacter intestinalis TaxID=2941507 RepID=UPI0020400805|nr:hypothetical protein [Senimuribacter intestinalis]
MAYEKKEYQESGAYQSAYQDTISGLVNKVASGEKFNYNPMTDQAYQAYASQYKRLGDAARQNTLSDVAINTGGLASSYATSAAAQAQNEYNQALTDKIPELEALAYEKYNNERNYNLNALGALQALDDSAYGRWSNDRDYNRSKYEYDQNFDFQNYVDDRNFGYQQERDKVADAQFDKTYDLDVKNYKLNKQAQEFNQKMQKDEFKYKKMLDTWNTYGYATSEVAKYFGVKKGTATSDQKYKDADLAYRYAALNASKSSGSGGGSGGSGGSGNNNKKKTDPRTKNKSSYQKNMNALRTQVNIANGKKKGLSNEGVIKTIKRDYENGYLTESQAKKKKNYYDKQNKKK